MQIYSGVMEILEWVHGVMDLHEKLRFYYTTFFLYPQYNFVYFDKRP